MKSADLAVGEWVEYIGNAGEREVGRIKSWNDNWIFVVYKCAGEWDRFTAYTGQATKPEQLHPLTTEEALALLPTHLTNFNPSKEEK